MASVITINGQRIEIEGNASVSVRDGVITVGGTTVSSGHGGRVHVEWVGPLATLNCDGSATIHGTV